jgi:hypothetical protein
MSTLKITDLETSSELDREAMIAVTGGMGNSISQGGGLFAPVANAGGSGFSFASPTTIVSTPINVPVAINLDLDTVLDLDTQLANVVGSASNQIIQ